jgi:hypothetical protein
MSEARKNVELLRRFNAWRRGANGDMPAPADVGRAIDWAIRVCEAAENLTAVKGRHHSQEAYDVLVDALKVGAGETAKTKEG